MSKTRSRASLYVRLSKTASETNLSLDGMMNDVRSLARRLDVDIVAERTDNGVSGAVRDRPEFLAWLEDARSGVADVLLTYHADRLTREGVNAAALVLDTLEGKDPTTGAVVRSPVRLVDCNGLDSDDAEAFRWRFLVAAEVARGERERIKARNIATRDRMNAAGRYTGGPPPYGCRVVPNPDGGGKVLVADPDEAELLREVARKLLAGTSVRLVLQWLNERATTRRGSRWISSSLRGTLRSEATRTHVLDVATSRALDERFARNRTNGGGRPRKFLLSGGQAVCGSCGTRMSTSGNRYMCSSASESVPCSRVVTLKIEPADSWLEDQFLSRYGDHPALELRVLVLGGADVDGAERAVTAAEAALLADLTQENMTALADARESLRKANEVPPMTKRAWVSTGQTIAEKWASAQPDERASMLRMALARPVVVRPSAKRPGRGSIDLVQRLDIAWNEGALSELWNGLNTSNLQAASLAWSQRSS